MTHSGKTITFATDLLPQENNIYNLGDAQHLWNIYATAPTATPNTNNQQIATTEFVKKSIEIVDLRPQGG